MDGSKDNKILIKDILGLKIEDWRLFLDQKDVQDVKKLVEDPGIQDLNSVVVDNIEREYMINNEMEENMIDIDSNSEIECSEAKAADWKTNSKG